ncbi:MAG: hypothetical protein QM727_04960 [Niabella sp.]
MKRKSIFTVLILFCSVSLLAMKNSESRSMSDSLEGAWVLSHKDQSFTMSFKGSLSRVHLKKNYEGQELVLLFQDGYSMFTQYSLSDKKFVNTSGGPYTIADGKIKVKEEFNSGDKIGLGKWNEYEFTLANDVLTVRIEGVEPAFTWKRIDAGNENLAGNWRITQRRQGDQMADIPLRARRTLKLLTATRFQWAAINIETGEFFGTGGGTYTFKDGTYTENIEFFSRDSSRVGMSLSFDGKLENGKWIHSGKSSKGEPIYEIWERMR